MLKLRYREGSERSGKLRKEWERGDVAEVPISQKYALVMFVWGVSVSGRIKRNKSRFGMFAP